MSTSARPRVPPNCDLTLGLHCVDKSRPDVGIWAMPADERFANPVGVIQGGIVAALADTAMAATSVTWSRDRGMRVYTANTEMKISYLRPARADNRDLVATATVISGGRRVVFIECEVADADGKLCAKASSTYLLTPRDS